MRVIIPPMLLAKARGMRRRRGDMPAVAAMLTTIGSIRATVPVLLTNMPIAEVTIMTRRKSLSSLFPASAITLLPIIFARPVWKIPPPTMNRPIIMITVVLEKPERASAGFRIWHKRRARRAHIATRSERTLPVTKSIADIRSIIKVAIINIYFEKGCKFNHFWGTIQQFTPKQPALLLLKWIKSQKFSYSARYVFFAYPLIFRTLMEFDLLLSILCHHDQFLELCSVSVLVE